MEKLGPRERREGKLNKDAQAGSWTMWKREAEAIVTCYGKLKANSAKNFQLLRPIDVDTAVNILFYRPTGLLVASTCTT